MSLITSIFDMCYRSLAAVTHVKYGCDVQLVTSALIEQNICGNNDEIGPVIPTLVSNSDPVHSKYCCIRQLCLHITQPGRKTKNEKPDTISR